MNTAIEYDEVGRSSTWKANIWTGDHATKYIFDDGHMVSLLWGAGSYGSTNEFGQATYYEIAVVKPDGEFLKLSEWDDVLGDRSWDTVQHILGTVNDGRATDLELTY